VTKQVPVLLNIETIETMLDLYRDGLDMKIPLADEFKVHFMTRRKPLLEGFVKLGEDWRLMFRCLSENGDPDGLAAARQVVDGFLAWAEAELEQLKHL